MQSKLISALANAAFAFIATALVLTAYASAASHEKVLAFLDPARGTYPSAELVFDTAGNLYGTTTDGGIYGFDTVFELQPTSGGGWKTVVLHNFSGAADGLVPSGPLVIDSAGNLFGVTFQGGDSSCSYHCGTVFELSPSNGSWKKSVIYAFKGSDGRFPAAGLVFDNLGNLYGTTSEGGSVDAGTVFELMPTNGGWTETVLYSFGSVNGDGSSPRATLIFDSSGNLYGTTAAGGIGDHGTVFELSPGSTGWTETVIHNFWVTASNPQAGLVFDSAGNLYGTTLSGGRNGFGIVFELSLSAGRWSKKSIHQFSGGVDGGQPFARLAFSGGKLYGTTSSGGAVGVGVVFELKPTSGGGWQETVLHAFQAGNDGANPYAGVILDKLGNLYGTTMGGGRLGQGTVFEVTP
jgi:uncharacterized repeat protein (TIGR03803 family)